jgi:hypothetical protein
MGKLSEQYRSQQATKIEADKLKKLANRILRIGAGVVLGTVILILAGWLLWPPSGEERYNTDRQNILNAMRVLRAGLHPDVPESQVGLWDYSSTSDSIKGRYPTFAAKNVGHASALQENDAGSDPITTLGIDQSNPTGSRNWSGTPYWEDIDGDRIRDPTKDSLYYHNASPDPDVDHWNTTAVSFREVRFVVDSRDWFIDIDTLVDKGYLKEVPKSASADNGANGSGNYSWYVDENGEVKSMFYRFPKPETDGYQDVYP